MYVCMYVCKDGGPARGMLYKGNSNSNSNKQTTNSSTNNNAINYSGYLLLMLLLLAIGGLARGILFKGIVKNLQCSWLLNTLVIMLSGLELLLLLWLKRYPI